MQKDPDEEDQTGRVRRGTNKRRLEIETLLNTTRRVN